MPAIWRPNVGRVLPDVDVEVGVTEDASSKGTKRKRAPRTKGPCEHGVKYRSQCKVCSACPHGKKHRLCKECGGASICAHGRQRTQCKECGGSGICEHGRSSAPSNLSARRCGGSGICEHGRHAIDARSAVGLKSASTVVSASVQGVRPKSANTVVTAQSEHGRRRSRCKECKKM